MIAIDLYISCRGTVSQDSCSKLMSRIEAGGVSIHDQEPLATPLTTFRGYRQGGLAYEPCPYTSEERCQGVSTHVVDVAIHIERFPAWRPS